MMVHKNDIRKLELLIDDFKHHNIKFKVYESKKGDRNKDFYYIISKSFLGLEYTFEDDDLESYGEEVDYDVIIISKKYNI